MSDIAVRPALPDEGPALTRLCIESKAHWGYDAAFLARCTPGLTVTPRAIADGEVFCAAGADGVVLGLHALDFDGATADLDKLLVAPEAIGRGIGALLFRHATATAAARGCRELTILADPNAAAFYARMGAEFVAMAPSDAIPGRELPLYRYPLPASTG